MALNSSPSCCFYVEANHPVLSWPCVLQRHCYQQRYSRTVLLRSFWTGRSCSSFCCRVAHPHLSQEARVASCLVYFCGRVFGQPWHRIPYKCRGLCHRQVTGAVLCAEVVSLRSFQLYCGAQVNVFVFFHSQVVNVFQVIFPRSAKQLQCFWAELVLHSSAPNHLRLRLLRWPQLSSRGSKCTTDSCVHSFAW